MFNEGETEFKGLTQESVQTSVEEECNYPKKLSSFEKHGMHGTHEEVSCGK